MFKNLNSIFDIKRIGGFFGHKILTKLKLNILFFFNLIIYF